MMWIRLQCTMRCAVCSERSPVNAAVSELPCAACGADLELTERLWKEVLEQAQRRGASLEPNGATVAEYSQRGAKLRLQLARVDPYCPHCEEPLSPQGASSFDCPGCGEELSVRPSPVKAEGVGVLLGEDRALRRGERSSRRTITLSCEKCGAPLTADGSHRKLSCGACGVEQVLADEVWRRIHAPTQVAPWFIRIEGEGSEEVLGGLHAVHSIAAGRDGRLYLIGAYGELDYCLLAVEPHPLRLLWSVPLPSEEADRITVGADGQLALYCADPGGAISWFHTKNGEHLGDSELPLKLLALRAAADGTFLGVNHPNFELVRLNRSGKILRAWTSPGCLGWLKHTLMPNGSRPAHVGAYESMGVGWDGDVRIVGQGQVRRLDNEGNLVWRVAIPATWICSIPPGAAEDGTTFFVGIGQEGESLLYRIDADGRNPVCISAPGDLVMRLAVLPNGVLFVDGARLCLLDRDGHLLWENGEAREH